MTTENEKIAILIHKSFHPWLRHIDEGKILELGEARKFIDALDSKDLVISQLRAGLARAYEALKLQNQVATYICPHNIDAHCDCLENRNKLKNKTWDLLEKTLFDPLCQQAYEEAKGKDEKIKAMQIALTWADEELSRLKSGKESQLFEAISTLTSEKEKETNARSD